MFKDFKWEKRSLNEKKKKKRSNKIKINQSKDRG